MLAIIKVIMMTSKQKLSSYNELVTFKLRNVFSKLCEVFQKAGKGHLVEMQIILVYTFDPCLSPCQLQMFQYSEV